MFLLHLFCVSYVKQSELPLGLNSATFYPCNHLMATMGMMGITIQLLLLVHTTY